MGTMEKRFCTCGYANSEFGEPLTCIPEREKYINYQPILNYWSWEEGTYYYSVAVEDGTEGIWDFDEYPTAKDLENILISQREAADDDNYLTKAFIYKSTLRYNEKEEIEEYRWEWETELIKEIDLK